MTIVPIPPWSALGVLPPIDDGDPTSFSRSPYSVSLNDLVERFATSDQRCRVLDGLLRFRAALHESGVVSGFQWFDGSFLEDVETLEARPPRDVDVVSFIELPADFDPDRLPSPLFDHGWVKDNLLVDSYFVELDLPPRELVALSSYWYSVWSHRRSHQWKGYLQVDLSPAEDAVAWAALPAFERKEG